MLCTVKQQKNNNCSQPTNYQRQSSFGEATVAGEHLGLPPVGYYPDFRDTSKKPRPGRQKCPGWSEKSASALAQTL